MSNTTLKSRIAATLERHLRGRELQDATDAVCNEVKKDISLLWLTLDATTTSFGTYPSRPDSKPVWQAADLVRKQYAPELVQ